MTGLSETVCLGEGATSFVYADALGYLASGFVLAAFWMQSLVRLRVLAVFSNLAFILYALIVGLAPVLLLHAVLLPLNLFRLREMVLEVRRRARERNVV